MGNHTDTGNSSIDQSRSHVKPNKTQRYPKSFLKFILLGFLLVGTPLIFALIDSAITIDRLAEQSRETVHQATQVTHGNRVLADEVLSMERSLRQALILSDLSLLERYFHSHANFELTADELIKLPLQTEQQLALKEIRLAETLIFREVLKTQIISESLLIQIDELSNLFGSIRIFSDMSNELIDTKVNNMLQMASDARKRVERYLLALIPFVIFLAIFFSILITRPIKQIDEAIYNLGQGELSKTINIKGPQSLKYLGERLDWMRRRLLKLEDQKIQFFRHVSHELKTPLTAIREGADLLAGGVTGHLTKKQQLIADILQSSSLQLQKRIEDLLSYSAIQAEKTALVKHWTNLTKILDKVLQNQNLSIMSKSLKINRNFPDFLFECDEDKIETILDNLISNAIKFSPQEGCIEIHTIKKNEIIQLDIKDAGIGIHNSDKDKIFEPFFQGQSTPDSHVKGTGLGLSIAQEFALAHGGKITLINGTENGAHFRLMLPISDPKETT